MKRAIILLVMLAAAGCGAMPVEVVDDQEQSAGQEVPRCLSDSDCDDGRFCNGKEQCADGLCVASGWPCGEELCNESQGQCVQRDLPTTEPDDFCSSDTECQDGFFCNGFETCDRASGLCFIGDRPCGNQACDEGQNQCAPLDECPNDPGKIEPGLCGCGQPDTGNDTDADGVPDCVDLCPLDPIKIAPGICGCGIDDLDLDRDGFPDLCLDNCPFTFNPSQLDSDLDGLGDVCDPFPAGSGDVFSFLTPDETELFLIFVARLNADIDSFVDSELALALFDLGSRGFFCSSLVCNEECDAEQSRISLKRDGTALSAIDAAASFGINLILGLAERQEIDDFNCQNYPNKSFDCTRALECGLGSILCTVGGFPCD